MNTPALSSAHEYVVGVDLGGTQLRAILADRTGTILAQSRLPTDAHEGPDAVIDRIATCITSLYEQVPAGGLFLGVGVGAPGPLNPHEGVVMMAPNMANWNNVPLRARLEATTGLHVVLGNDANVAALGEWLFGGGRGYHDLIYVTVSTGIGGGVIINDKLLLGRQGAGGEIGHLLIDNFTSWENLASGTALANTAIRLLGDHPQSSLAALADQRRLTAADVAQAASNADAFAQELMEREARYLGLGFASLLHAFSPEIILVGGGVVTANPHLLETARTTVDRYTIAEVYRSVPIQVAQLGEQVGVVGAAALMFYSHDNPDYFTT